ncbi:MAG TPA: cyclic nucleotide-binding domain-containing protein [Vicinamibacteria bacterium]|nr:cyclic nucleotide-binding domain-containing protein [Vicinamibacteria bacterium]
MAGGGRLFDVQAGEGRSVALMLGHSFAMGAATVFFETAASALFLARFGASALPYVYVAAALVNIAAGVVYSRVQDRVPFARLMTGTLWFLLLSVGALRLGLGLTGAAWLYFLLLVWYRALSILTDLEYWAVAARLYDVRQAKRLFGLVGSGEVVARIAGAAAVPLLVGAFGVASLVLLSAIALAACLVLAAAVLRLLPPGADPGPRPSGAAVAPRAGLRGLFSERYLRVVVVLAFFGVLAKYLVDFAFLEQMRSRYADARGLATFFALFSAFSQAASLLTRVLFSGRVLARFGVRGGLTVLPSAHVACTALIVGAGFFPETGPLVFWLVVSNQAIYKTLKHPIDNPSFKILYQPLPRDQRLSTQIAVETLVTPLTIGLAGGLMLLFSKAIPYDPVVFAWLMLAVFGGWEIMAKGAGYEYAEALVQALKRRVVDDEPFTYGDARSLAVLRRTLGSDEPVDVLFALDLLEKARADELEPALVGLLGHASPDVRRSALLRLERMGARGAQSAVGARALADPVPAVRAVALRASCALGGSEAWTAAEGALDDPSPEVRRGALIGLLRVGHEPARDRLAGMAASPVPAERMRAARVAAEAANSGMTVLLSTLLADADAGVRRAALAAAGRVRDRMLWPAVAEALGDRRLRATAVAALAAGGDEVVDVLAPFLDGAAAAPVARDAARVLGRVRGERAVEALRARIAYPDQLVRLEVLEALRACGHAPPPGSEAARAVRAQLEQELYDAAWTEAVLSDLAGEGLHLLREALRAEMDRRRQAVLLLLSFLYDPVALLRARDGLAHGSRERRAYALEVLDVSVEADLKAEVLRIMVAAEAPAEARGEEATPATAAATAGRVREVAGRPRAQASAWTTVCAVQAAAHLGGDWDEVLRAAAEDPSPMVRETAAWAGACLAGVDGGQGGRRMLTIERVISLKAVPMFGEASEEILADVAELLEEVEYLDGQVIFEKGAPGDSLYIVISGRVRVYDGARTIVHLGEKEIFGELALLDPEPRVASVAAVEPTRLFRLDREAFAELMAGNIEIVRGVLHVLCERLRGQGAYPGDRQRLDTAAPSGIQGGAPITPVRQEVR